MRILLLDIETAPHLAMVWGLWKETIPLERLQKPGYTLCWAAKWLGQKEIHFSSVKHDGKRKMIQRIHKLLDEADAVIHYNGSGFDIPTLNAEFVQMAIRPPSPFRHIDLYQVVKKQFRFPSNKLDYVLRALGIGAKVKHKGMQMWIDCMAGEEPAWRKMRTYNIGDVTELEKLYTHLLPWIHSHPNYGLHGAGRQCPSCGSTHLQRRGIARTAVNRYQRFQCVNCGAWSREGYSETGTQERRELLRPVAA